MEDPGPEHLINAVRTFAGKRTSGTTLQTMIARLPVASAKDFFDYIKESGNLIAPALQIWNRRLSRTHSDSKEVTALREAVLMHNLGHMLLFLDDSIATAFSGVSYLGPVRARAERYYRNQELGVQGIHHDGGNVPMLLNSLTDEARAEFSAWCEEMFGFGIEASLTHGHASINIISKDGQSTNMTDVGFGYSQLLPFTLQLWLSARDQRRERSATMIAIEQPELHLHPFLQQKVAEVLGHFATSRARRGKLPILIETHSEAIVNSLGLQVAEGKLKADDVQIIVFDGQTGDVKVATYSEDGALLNWPYGFLSPAGGQP